MPDLLNVLIVEDSEDDALLVLRELRQGGFKPAWERVQTAEDLYTALTIRPWDVIISDYQLPKFNAPAALTIAKQSQPNLPFIVVSGTIGETSAVELMKAGAHDYLMKDNLTRLPEVVRREVREAQIRVERQQAALELDRAKERLQLAIEGSGIGLWDWSVQTGSVILNDRWAEIIGYTLEELEPISMETCWSHTCPEDLQQANLALAQHFRKETQVYECELRMQHKLGSWVWVLVRGKVVEWDAIGRPLRMTGTHLDITARKLAEATLSQLNQDLERRVEHRTAALQYSEARLREAHQVARLGSWEFDVQTRKITWSAEIFNIFGLSPEQAEPAYEQLLQDYVLPDERERFIYLMDRAIQGGEAYATDLKIIRTDGSFGYIFVKAEPNRNTEARVIRLFGIVMDISDRKRLEQEQNRLIAILQASTDYISMADATGTIVWENAELKRLRGFAWDEAVLPRPLVACHPQWAADLLVQQGLPTAIAHGSWIGETALLDADTNEIPVSQLILAHKSPQGAVEFFSSIMRDMRVRKEYEQTLERSNAELLRATRLKDEFLANMSHELRTPLNAILGMSEGLQENIFGPLNQRQLQAIGTIEHSGRHLLDLINDILEVSKIEAGKLELEITTVSILHLCDSSLAFVKQQAIQKNIYLETDFPRSLGQIRVDERRMRQVLINLLNNAVKFTPAGGRVILKVQLEEADDCAGVEDNAALGPSTVSGTLGFSIIDTGIGIAAADQAKLFQPFMQIDSSLNRQYAGTGLGLTLVKQIVELHGGSVSVQSVLGQGSCFTVRVPYLVTTTPLDAVLVPNSAEQAAVQIPAPTPPLADCEMQGDRPRILLAEDNQTNIDTLADYLTLRGYHIILARNGIEAIAQTQTHHPDVILMDIQMPGMDGLEAIQHIRQDPQLAEIPIIALTALAMSGDRDRCLNAGANDYLAKPVKLKQLAATIQQWLGS